MSTPAEGRAVAQRFYDVLNSGDLNRLDIICAPDLKGHAGAGDGLAELKRGTAGFVAGFPDLAATPRHIIVEGDLVSTWVTYTGTQLGEFAGVPASGRSVRFAAWDLLRIRDGRIVEITQYCDLFTILNQIGALPTTAPA